MKKNLKEKCRLVTGFGAWHIGKIHVSDGPHGVRAQEDGAKNNDSYVATCFPTASSVACSWNTDLIGKMAEAIATEAKELGVSVVLGPGVNMKRSPLCGRNFEYYSEDPFLAGALASAYISSVQKNGVGTSIKHFAANSQETHRMTANSMIDERALHEIYLSAFEMAVKKAKPATVMGSYNFINGESACENKYLLTEVLRKKWGYEGLVMSDWGACVNLPGCIAAGMDVEMPDSRGNHYEELMNAVKDGSLSEESLNRAVERIEELNRAYKSNIIPDAGEKRVAETTKKAHHKLAEQIEEENAVLLKNDGFLPLPGEKEILIVGDLAIHPRIQGGGSSHIHTESVDSFMEEFEKLGVKVQVAKGYGCNSFETDARLEKEAFSKVKEAMEKRMPILFFGGLTDIAEGEGYDRESYDLPENQKHLLKQILDMTNEVCFVSFSGSPYNMELPAKCKAILQMYLGGESVAAACAKIVMGLVNPSGKLAESIPYSEKDVPSYGYFGNQGEQKQHLDDVEYRESIFMGYRYYDTFRVPVRYCFGYGLSYTSFQYSDLSVERQENTYRVSFYIRNIGDREGSETAQVYVRNPKTDDFRPKRELRGFSKIKLKPGEKKKVEVFLMDRAFSVYQNGEFQVIGGDYEIQIGASLEDIRLKQEISVEGVSMESPLTLGCDVPLSEDNFEKIYTYQRTDFSHLKPGQFTLKNSLLQMSPYSSLARKWIAIGKMYARLTYFPKSLKDPEVRMMVEGIVEGNVDNVCNQSGGFIKRDTVMKIVESANRGKVK